MCFVCYEAEVGVTGLFTISYTSLALKYPRDVFASARASALKVKNINYGRPESVPHLFSNGLSYAVKSHCDFQHTEP